MIKTCVICGKQFDTKGYRGKGRSKTCNIICSAELIILNVKKSTKRNKLQYLKEHPPVVERCVECGKLFPKGLGAGRTRNALTCDKRCQYEYGKRRVREGVVEIINEKNIPK